MLFMGFFFLEQESGGMRFIFGLMELMELEGGDENDLTVMDFWNSGN